KMEHDLPLDEFDQCPTWNFALGERVVDGCLAWERLGVGQRCETWLAWSQAMWAPVAVKLVRPHQVAEPRGRRAIGREVKALRACHHPALPRLLADGRQAEVAYLVTEYLDGPTLEEALDDDGPLLPPDAAVLLAQLAGSVRAMHAAGFAHLDIKPANVV